MSLGLREYLFTWHLLIILVFFVGWLSVGTYLLRWMVCRRDLKSRITAGKCFGICMFSGMAGVASGAVLFALLYVIGSRAEVNLRIPAAVVGGLSLLAVNFLVISAMLDLPAGATFKVASLPIAAIIIWGLALAVPTAVIAYITSQENVKRRICRKNLSYVYKALKSYQDNFGRSAQGLGELVEGNFLNEINRKCPAAMDKEVGYFYFPILIPPKPGSDQLLMCDFSSNRKAEGRMVLFTNNLARWYSNEGFKRIVSLEQNTAFAEALVEAEGR